MAYANTDDIGALIGRDLTEDEENRAEACIALVSLAADAVLPNIDPSSVPAAVTAVVLSASLRRWLNPAGVMQESVGGYSASHPDAGKLLTDDELAVLRRAARRTGTMRTSSAAADESV
jgi:hypothetical protein